MASEFAQHINALSLKAPLQHRRPSPLEPPTAAVAAQMDALQINDWPEADAGVHTAVSVLVGARGGGHGSKGRRMLCVCGRGKCSSGGTGGRTADQRLARAGRRGAHSGALHLTGGVLGVVWARGLHFV